MSRAAGSCFVYFGDGKGGFGAGVRFRSRRRYPYSMIAADLNRDGQPEILVGYVSAPGVVYFNDGTGKKYPGCAVRGRLGCDLWNDRGRPGWRWIGRIWWRPGRTRLAL